MVTLNAIAIDDEPLALDVLDSFCGKTEGVDLKSIFTKLSEAKQYIEDNTIDLLFLDINMPAMSGINFYKSLDKDIMVIFTTAYPQYAVEGFDLNAIDYLLKPIEYERFEKATTKAVEYYKYKRGEQQNYIFIKADYSVYKVDTADILYIESLDNYIKLHLTNTKPIMTRLSMKAILNELPENAFIRVHRSYIVPFSRVTSVRNKQLHIGDTEIPIGTNYLDEITRMFQ